MKLMINYFFNVAIKYPDSNHHYIMNCLVRTNDGIKAARKSLKVLYTKERFWLDCNDKKAKVTVKLKKKEKVKPRTNLLFTETKWK